MGSYWSTETEVVEEELQPIRNGCKDWVRFQYIRDKLDDRVKNTGVVLTGRATEAST